MSGLLGQMVAVLNFQLASLYLSSLLLAKLALF